ncbi:MAG: HAD-IIA family hydrolase, partial [Actinomycetota bacterium]|nr:HAD-IIA family hydrolase [Actinomycetota bacterium]
YDGLVVDLDGVVVRVEDPIPEAVAALSQIEQPTVFVTNNATRRPHHWVGVLERAGLTVDPDRILTSAMAAAWLVGGQPPPRVLVIGEDGLRAALTDAGIPLVDAPDDADAVVVGWDRQLTWERLRDATLAIAGGARFVGTNADLIYPADDGPWPGNGAALAYLRAATGVHPEIAGKPERPLFELAAERLSLGDGRILVVGDQLDTDVTAAQRMGWDAALVLTGVARWSDLVGAAATPTWVLRHLGELTGPEPATIRRGQPVDRSAIRTLLEDAGWELGGAKPRPDHALVAVAGDDDIVGTIAWERDGDTASLQGPVVAASQHGRETGSHLVAQVLHELRSVGVQLTYLLVRDGDAGFEQLGFESAEVDDVPDDVRTDAGSHRTVLVRDLRSDAPRRSTLE